MIGSGGSTLAMAISCSHSLIHALLIPSHNRTRTICGDYITIQDVALILDPSVGRAHHGTAAGLFIEEEAWALGCVSWATLIICRLGGQEKQLVALSSHCTAGALVTGRQKTSQEACVTSPTHLLALLHLEECDHGEKSRLSAHTCYSLLSSRIFFQLL